MNQLNNIILAATLIGAFFMCILSYITGLKHGKQLSQAIVPKVSLNPLQPIVRAVEEHKNKKEEDKITDELEDIMGATKESMLETIKKAR